MAHRGGWQARLISQRYSWHNESCATIVIPARAALPPGRDVSMFPCPETADTSSIWRLWRKLLYV